MLRGNLDERNQNTTLRQFGWICQTLNMKRHRLYINMPDNGLVNYSVDKKNQLDVTFCIIYFSSNSYSTCFGQPCARHEELTTA